jgi:hypothetical protein
MSEDTTNGVRLLLTDIDAELEKKLSSKDKVILRSTKYLLESLPPIRDDLNTLKKHDAIGLASKNPKTAWLLFVGVFAVNSMINWSGIRKPILQAIIHFITGVMIPLDALP